jgi:hypothetical protein
MEATSQNVKQSLFIEKLAVKPTTQTTPAASSQYASMQKAGAVPKSAIAQMATAARSGST